MLSDAPFAKELRLFGLADHFLSRLLTTYHEIHQAQRRQQLGELRWQTLLTLLTSLIGGGAFVLVVLRAFSGGLSVGDVTLYMGAVGSVQLALTTIVCARANLNESLLFQLHYQQLLAMPQPLAIAANPRPVPPLTCGIELRGVAFRYSEQHHWVLRDINCFIPAGRCLALVGLNGAGKTTLVKLLTRCYDPTEGQILWDGIDIHSFDPQELRRRIGAIFQDFVHYDLTAHDNIALGDVARLDQHDCVRQAAERAGVHETIEDLPQGYETVLSRWLAEEGPGIDLSGGQWQKIAMARMFMRPADLLVLDEPTAALDAQAEYDLYRHFVDLMSERTSLLISHRLSTVRMADHIVVLADGRISERGTHSELLAVGGAYAWLYQMQAE